MSINKFITNLDLARQAEILSGETAVFQGGMQLGIPFSGFPSGVDTNTIVSLGVIETQYTAFSGDSGTTIFDIVNPSSPYYSVSAVTISASPYTVLDSGTITETVSATTYPIIMTFTALSGDCCSTPISATFNPPVVQELYDRGLYNGLFNGLGQATIGDVYSDLSFYNDGSVFSGANINMEIINYGVHGVTPTWVTGTTSGTVIEYSGLSQYWSNPIYSSLTSGLTLPITPISSDTQTSNYIWTLTDSTIIDDNLIGLQYTGYNVTYSFENVQDEPTTQSYVIGGVYATLEYFSASTLDYKDSVRWLKVRGNAEVDARLTTNKITITNGASASTIGYVLKQTGPNGEAEWQFNSSGGTDTYVTGGTLDGSNQLTLDWNNGGSASPIDLSSLSDSTYWTSGSSGTYSVKVVNGGTTDATNDYAVASGFNTLASGLWSTSQNIGTTASGQPSHAEGEDTVASGDYGSHAEGYQTIASGWSSHSEGSQTTASGNYSHAEGYNSQATGTTSHSEGYQTQASGYASHAEGGNTVASGDYSHSEGFSNSNAESIASGFASHAEGGSQATNEYSHGQNYANIASGIYSHAGGYGNEAKGNVSFSHFYGQVGSILVYGVSGDTSAILGGSYHKILTNANDSGIFAGYQNEIIGGVNRSVILGGQNITGTTNDTVYVPNLTIREDHILHSDTTLEVTDIPSSFEDTFKGSYTEFNWTGLTTQIISNSNPEGYSSFLLGNLSNFPTTNEYGFLSYFGSGYTRTGTPTTGTDFYRDKVVLKGSDDTSGVIFSLSKPENGTMWWEIGDESKMILNENNLGIGLNPNGTETPQELLHVGGNIRSDGQIYVGTVTGGTVTTGNTFTYDCDLGMTQKLDLQGATTGATISFTNQKEGSTYTLVVVQGSGLYDLTFPSGWWLNDTAPFDFTTLADNDRTLVTSTYLDGEWYFAVKSLTLV